MQSVTSEEEQKKKKHRNHLQLTQSFYAVAWNNAQNTDSKCATQQSRHLTFETQNVAVSTCTGFYLQHTKANSQPTTICTEFVTMIKPLHTDAIITWQRTPFYTSRCNCIHCLHGTSTSLLNFYRDLQMDARKFLNEKRGQVEKELPFIKIRYELARANNEETSRFLAPAQS